MQQTQLCFFRQYKQQILYCPYCTLRKSYQRSKQDRRKYAYLSLRRGSLFTFRTDPGLLSLAETAPSSCAPPSLGTEYHLQQGYSNTTEITQECMDVLNCTFTLLFLHVCFRTTTLQHIKHKHSLDKCLLIEKALSDSSRKEDILFCLATVVPAI